MVQPLWKTVWRFLKKLKIELSYDPAIPLQGIYQEKTIVLKVTCTPMFSSALFTKAGAVEREEEMDLRVLCKRMKR